MGKRTPNLRSSIYQGADGRWHGWVTMGIEEGRFLDRRHRTAKTETEVTAKVQDPNVNETGGQPARSGKPLTVADWLGIWLTTVAPRTVAQSTLESTYEPKVRRWIIPYLGKHRLDRLQPEHLDAFYTKLAAEGLKPNTVVQIHRILSRALKVAWKRGKSLSTSPRWSTRRSATKRTSTR